MITQVYCFFIALPPNGFECRLRFVYGNTWTHFHGSPGKRRRKTSTSRRARCMHTRWQCRSNNRQPQYQWGQIGANVLGDGNGSIGLNKTICRTGRCKGPTISSRAPGSHLNHGAINTGYHGSGFLACLVFHISFIYNFFLKISSLNNICVMWGIEISSHS